MTDKTTPKPRTRKARTPKTTNPEETSTMSKTLTPSTYETEAAVLTADPALVDLRAKLAEIDAHREAVVAEKIRRVESLVLFEVGSRVLGYLFGDAPATDDDLTEWEITSITERRSGSRAEPVYGPGYHARAVRKDGLLADKAPRQIEVVREAPAR